MRSSHLGGDAKAVAPAKIADKPMKKKQAKERFNRQGRVFKHEVDTNVISLSLKVLKEDAELAAGDPVFCKQCNAVFNMFSKIEEKGKQLEEIKEEVDEDMADEEVKLEKDVVMEDDNKEEILAHQKDEGTHIWKCEF